MGFGSPHEANGDAAAGACAAVWARRVRR